MIRCIQIGGPNGPLIQGPVIGGEISSTTLPLRITGRATVRDGSRIYTGRLVESYRRKG